LYLEINRIFNFNFGILSNLRVVLDSCQENNDQLIKSRAEFAKLENKKIVNDERELKSKVISEISAVKINSKNLRFIKKILILNRLSINTFQKLVKMTQNNR